MKKRILFAGIVLLAAASMVPAQQAAVSFADTGPESVGFGSTMDTGAGRI